MNALLKTRWKVVGVGALALVIVVGGIVLLQNTSKNENVSPAVTGADRVEDQEQGETYVCELDEAFAIFLATETDSKKYTFEKYPTSSVRPQMLAELDTQGTASAAEFKSMISGALDEVEVDLGGKYAAVSVGMTGWGINYWIVDRETGHAYEFPYMANHIESRADSDLIVMNSVSYLKGLYKKELCYHPRMQGPAYGEMRPAYFLWKNGTLTPLSPQEAPKTNPFWKEYFNN